jgi:hypothetical protein
MESYCLALPFVFSTLAFCLSSASDLLRRPTILDVCDGGLVQLQEPGSFVSDLAPLK